jgi:hypothetical protein
MAPKQFDIYVEGLNELLRDFSKLGKEAAKELRASSKTIAERHMVPAWKNAALNYAGPWGSDIADSVRAGSDRVPKVMIGGNRKVTSGGATPTMLRYPSDKGDRGRAGAGARNRMPAAFGSGTDWISQAKTYQQPAIEEWSRAVDRVVMKWLVM